MGKVSIILQQCNGATFPIEIALNAKVSELKSEIWKKRQINASEMIVQYCGDELQNSSTLESCGIAAGAILSLEFRTAKITLNISLPTEENITVTVDSSATKEDVIKAIKASNHSLPTNIDIVFPFGEWTETITAGDIGPEENVVVVAKEPGGNR